MLSQNDFNLANLYFGQVKRRLTFLYLLEHKPSWRALLNLLICSIQKLKTSGITFNNKCMSSLGKFQPKVLNAVRSQGWDISREHSFPKCGPNKARPDQFRAVIMARFYSQGIISSAGVHIKICACLKKVKGSHKVINSSWIKRLLKCKGHIKERRDKTRYFIQTDLKHSTTMKAERS